MPTISDLLSALDGHGLTVTDLEEVALTLGVLGSGLDLADEIHVGHPTVEEAFGEPLYSVRVGKDEASAKSYGAAALALHTLAKENGE